jgi:hypothetical protein
MERDSGPGDEPFCGRGRDLYWTAPDANAMIGGPRRADDGARRSEPGGRNATL